MTTRSGLEGFCDVCGHANDHHQTSRCPAQKCKNYWKECTVGCFPSGQYNRMCYGCVDHPAVKESPGLFNWTNKRDVSKKQREEVARTGRTGGDSPSGKTKEEEVRRELEKARKDGE
ncbi:uncharacterized protein BP01DRAFT_102108 [Aspergillus saccharolyticus JOP 1030-1]|uniref:Uncharacterized protein n=1 Tax=Aspergillus saccharolyticus JOP 1030-1 TaxID=1450539 RepID=A0A318ZAI6_9EURO|nr:hypothetical protein BP01DRAFT_102108 [Aspergillus saccharolyticus JOP 1030-1]PYH43334.1 hypothetical protein BP01DRAFT_102108 [Aspergillus saccharolyticus JOP 1030-1]